MYSISLKNNNIAFNAINKTVTNPNNNVTVNSAIYTPNYNTGISAKYSNSIRTELATSQEQAQYATLLQNVDAKGRMQLNKILKNGRLLDNKSDDGSTTLENLYKIATTQRADGLDNKVVLKETLNAIEKPFVINQKFGDIPNSYKSNILNNAKPNPDAKDDEINEETINVEASSSCVSASIEFNLAHKHPAEFARFAQELSSPKLSVQKTIDLKNLTEKTLDSIWLLNNFKIPYTIKGDKAELTLAPDKNAIIRARIQNSNKDRGERSLVDALMQSTFMNIGSQQSYDALTDTRGGKFSQDNKGLIEFEKTFTESVVLNQNKTSITYQEIDPETNKFVKHTDSYKNIAKHIDDTLKMGENIVIGYTFIDKNKDILGGHEITIIGSKTDKLGNVKYICNDTDDNKSAPIEFPAKYLLPLIHHAGLPQKVVANDIEAKETWIQSLENYKASKAENISES